MGTIRRHVVEHPRTNETTQVLQLLSTFEKRKACLQRSIFWLAPLQQLCLAAPVVRSTLPSWDRGPRPPVAFTSKLLVLMRVVFPKAPQPDSATVTSVVEPPPPSLDFFFDDGRFGRSYVEGEADSETQGGGGSQETFGGSGANTAAGGEAVQIPGRIREVDLLGGGGAMVGAQGANELGT